ncbi:MAG: ABC transporter substrate-binding protein [Burkholderiaceae bacterium]
MQRPNPTRRSLLKTAPVLAALSTSLPLLAQPQNARSLKVVSPWEVMTLDPSKTGHIFTRLEVAETLVEVDDKGLLTRGLANRWSTSADGLEWRFGIRPTARFHDNTQVTAEAVAASLQRALAQPGLLRSTGAQQVTAQGSEVVLRLSRPFSALPAFLAHNSTLVLAPASYAADGSVRQIIGSGPYQVVEVNAPQSLRTRRFEGFDGRKPVIEMVDYLGASRGETRGMMALSGQADLVFTHDPVSYGRLRANRQLQLHRLPMPRTIYIKVNAGHRFLADLRVRRALSLALDRTGMATALMRAPEAAANQLFPPIVAEWHVPGLAPLMQNLETSRALLRSVSWHPEAAMACCATRRRAFRLTLRTFADRPSAAMATAIRRSRRWASTWP